MKYKLQLLFLCVLVTIGLVVNSCSKDTQNNIQTLFVGSQWELASVQVTHYIGASQVGLVDTLNTNCNNIQLFKFNADNTCTYTNFDCLPNTTAKGHWSLSADQLFLYAGDLVVQDTTTNHNSKPFQTARIVNLGQYSLILQTGNLETYYPPTMARTITQYGFIRQKIQ
ncbi:MAG: hypothetical protein JWP37_2330 [Mucilaginibacter sp.]|nr:hypothetical protein [Mucilaginibacter sp.]